MGIRSIGGTILFIIVLGSILIPLLQVPIASAQLPLPAGVPRGDVLVVTMAPFQALTNPRDWNYQIIGKRPGWAGYHQVCAGFLWYANTTNGELIPWLADGLPQYSQDATKVIFKLRKDAYWNDGAPFTADDVIFTVETSMKTSQWVSNSYAIQWVKSMRKVDNYTIEFELTGPNPRFHYAFAVLVYSATFRIVPRHVWEGKDPVSFTFYPPVCIGPYNLKDVDPGGNWVLWEREENWWGTKVFGWKPSPKYILWINPGAETFGLRMSRNELDTNFGGAPIEQAEIVIKNNPYVIGWRRTPPYAWPYDSCIKGLTFNLFMYPYNITDVRRALAHTINYSKVLEIFTGPDGSKPVTSILPVVPTPIAWKTYYEPLKDDLVKLGMDPNTWWWRYDPAYAEQQLKKLGFYRGTDGKWRLPDGTPWKISIIAPNGLIEEIRISYAVADDWNKFGIATDVNVVDFNVWATYGSRGPPGGVGGYYPACTLLIDLVPHIQSWNSKYFSSAAPACQNSGWCNYSFTGSYGSRADLDKILNDMEMTPATQQDRIIDLGRKALLIWAEQVPWLGFFPYPYYVFQNTYAWEGWPTYPDNYYLDPVSWWATFLFIVMKLYPSGKVPTKDALPVPGVQYAQWAGSMLTQAPRSTSTPTTMPISTPTSVPTRTQVIVSTVTVTSASSVTPTEVSGTLNIITILLIVIIALLVIILVPTINTLFRRSR